MRVPLFRYADDVTARFPTIVGGVVHAQGVTNGTSPPDLTSVFAEEQRLAFTAFRERDISQASVLARFRPGSFTVTNDMNLRQRLAHCIVPTARGGQRA